MPNIQINYDDKKPQYKMGTEVEYQCDIGYSNNYEMNKSTCQSNGEWNEIKFQCTSIYLSSNAKAALIFYYFRNNLR